MNIPELRQVAQRASEDNATVVQLCDLLQQAEKKLDELQEQNAELKKRAEVLEMTNGEVPVIQNTED